MRQGHEVSRRRSVSWNDSINLDAVVSWGRPYTLREGLEAVKKSEAEGGNGHAEKFWEWSEDQVQKYT